LIVLSVEQLQHLAIFDDKNITHISPLIGGLCHRLYKVTYQGQDQSVGHCVLRYLNVGAQDSVHEYNIMQLVFDLGVGPSPMALIDLTIQLQQPSSLIVMAFVEGEIATNDCFDMELVSQVADYLNALHASDTKHLTINPTPNTMGLLDEYWQRYNMKTVADIKRFVAIKRQLSTLSFDNTSLIHGDLNLSNILILNGKMIWLDWQYSSLGDAYIDYAALCVETDGKIEQGLVDALNINRHSDAQIDRTRLSLFKLYYATICWLWMPALTSQSYLNHHHRYERIVDQLLMAKGAGKTTLL